MYYCASRQNATSPALDEKPKDAYPNERICPFPQCQKSCPSASSLEIHMRSHSGESCTTLGRSQVGWEGAGGPRGLRFRKKGPNSGREAPGFQCSQPAHVRSMGLIGG